MKPPESSLTDRLVVEELGAYEDYGLGNVIFVRYARSVADDNAQGTMLIQEPHTRRLGLGDDYEVLGTVELSRIEEIANEFKKGIGSWRDTLTPSVIGAGSGTPEWVVEANYRFAEKVDALVESLGVEKIYELADLVKPLTEAGPVPNYPYKKDYHEMVIKKLLLRAIEEGKTALSISDSAPMKARYSEKYYKFYEMLYDKRIPSAMKRLVNKYGRAGDFEEGRLDVDDTFTQGRVHQLYESDPDVLQANIIRITPEMKEKILKEGIQAFGTGGIVDSGIAHLKRASVKKYAHGGGVNSAGIGRLSR